MNNKLLTIILVSMAVIAASTAAIVVSVKRADQARALAEKAASEEAIADAKRREAQSLAQAEAEKRRTAEAQRKSNADRLAAEKLASEQSKIDKATAEDNRKAREAEAVAAQANAEAARAKKAAAHDEAQAAADAKERAQAESAKAAEEAQTEAHKLEREKLKSEKTIADVKLLELKRIDFETIERDLREWQQELEERERAIKPDKTVADLTWAGGMEDVTVDENGDVRKVVKKTYLAEDDATLPVSTRILAKTERLCQESTQSDHVRVREKMLKSVEKLYESALRENRMIDVEFYRRNLLTIDPDWKYGVVTNSVAR